jgi:hypothetical protein
MKPEQQRIAIAEACGWTLDLKGAIRVDGYRIEVWGKRPHEALPDYLKDLNAMHEAEGVLEADDNHAYGCYRSNLYEKYGNTVSLTASQRAEAFLKTIGKWTTNPNEP